MTAPATLRVLAPGLITTVQDMGRVGYQRLGVSVSGALDPIGLRAANALVGNPVGEGGLEALYTGPTLVIDADSARIALVGAHTKGEILANENSSGGRPIEIGQSLRLERGSVVRIGSLLQGSVLYIAVEGGFAIEPVLGSVSTYAPGRMGGWHGRALIAGDRIPLRHEAATSRSEYHLKGLTLDVPKRFRAILGPQADYFSERAIHSLFTSSYEIGANSSRMGMHLTGPKLEHVRGYDIVSDGIAPGSIQVPGSGLPIILLADRQTTGGYPKIATVISADLPALGRLRIGDRIAFQEVSLEEAKELRRKLIGEIEGIHEKIVPLARTENELAKLLFEANLISGAVDAQAGL